MKRRRWCVMRSTDGRTPPPRRLQASRLAARGLVLLVAQFDTMKRGRGGVMSRLHGRREFLKRTLAAGAAVRLCRGVGAAPVRVTDFEDLIEKHPAGTELRRLFA